MVASTTSTEQVEVGAGDLELLLVKPQAAGEDAKADETVADDHDDGEHGVARQRRIGLAAQQERLDHRNLDDRDRQRQQQRAKRLADAVRDDLGMIHGRKHRAEQDHQQRDGKHEPAGVARKADAERAGGGKKQRGQHREDPGRPRHRARSAHDIFRYGASSALTMLSVIFLASPSSIMVLSR